MLPHGAACHINTPGPRGLLSRQEADSLSGLRGQNRSRVPVSDIIQKGPERGGGRSQRNMRNDTIITSCMTPSKRPNKGGCVGFMSFVRNLCLGSPWLITAHTIFDGRLSITLRFTPRLKTDLTASGKGNLRISVNVVQNKSLTMRKSTALSRARRTQVLSWW